MVGRLMFTMDVSSVAIKMPMARIASTAHLLACSWPSSFLGTVSLLIACTFLLICMLDVSVIIFYRVFYKRHPLLMTRVTQVVNTPFLFQKEIYRHANDNQDDKAAHYPLVKLPSKISTKEAPHNCTQDHNNCLEPYHRACHNKGNHRNAVDTALQD